MAPLVVGSASPGNAGRDFAAIKAEVADRILSAVRTRFPQAGLAPEGSTGRRLPGYESASGQHPVARDELDAASEAYARGATHLLVPTITEWKQMRTDDPVGALIVAHNSVTITLRLMRLRPPALVDQITFHNHARLTLNQKADRLLDGRFRRAVLRLLTG
jgi:hypothetical protein